MKKRVLIADDSEAIVTLLRTVLRPLDLDLHLASNGREAVTACQGGRFDLILMDSEMPELNGRQATIEIRSLEKQLNIRTPIVALTGDTSPENKERCMESGMDDFLSKPIVFGTLIETVKKWL